MQVNSLLKNTKILVADRVYGADLFGVFACLVQSLTVSLKC